MKTKAEIRRHRDDLKIARTHPCSCAEDGHEEGCREGARMMDAAIQVLTWALGEPCGDYDERMVAVMRNFVIAKERIN